MGSRRTFLIGLALGVMAAAVSPVFPKTDPDATGRGLVRIDIGGDWQFRQVGREDWHMASVPGCAAGRDELAGRLKVRTLRDSY